LPKRPPHPCRKHMWILVYDGDGCSECAKRPSPSHTLDIRPSANQRGYGREHQRKRDALIARVKYCQDPYGLHKDNKVYGTVRDHIVPLSKGGSDDESNEQLLCNRCHNIKIYQDGSRSRGGRGKSL
jgi:5-methylcytosine-specific restriction enzyme A